MTSPEFPSRTAALAVLEKKARNDMCSDLVRELNMTQTYHKEIRHALIRICQTFRQSISRLLMPITLFALFHCLHSFAHIPASSITPV